MFKFGSPYIYRHKNEPWTIDKYYDVCPNKEIFIDNFYSYILKTQKAKSILLDYHKHLSLLDPNDKIDNDLLEQLKLSVMGACLDDEDNHYMVLDNGVRIIVSKIYDGIPVSNELIYTSLHNAFSVSTSGITNDDMIERLNFIK